MYLDVSVIAPVSAATVISPQIQSWYNAALEDLEQNSGDLRCLTGWEEIVPIEIQVLRDSSRLPAIPGGWEGPRHRTSAWAQFAITAEVDIPEYVRILFSENPGPDPIDEPLAIGFAKDHLATTLSARVADIVMAANVARPGSLQAHGRFKFEGLRFLDRDAGLFNYFADAVTQCQELGWPSFEVLTIPSVLEWLDLIPNFIEGCPSGPAGVAVSSLSQLNSEPPPISSPAGLMWSMVGLEALYAEGTDGLKRQIMTKTEIVLGPRVAHLKRFNRIYDVRSRFIHGDSEFKLAYAPFDFYDDESSESKIVDAFALAQGMLLSSLQQLVLRNQHEFRFAYVLQD